jgi:hypothetical protein
MSLAKVWETFQLIEREESLTDWKVAGVYLWPAMKTRLLREVSESLGLISATDKQPSVFDIESPKDAEAHLAKPGKHVYAVVPFLRRDKNGRDQFTDPIVEAMREAGYEPLIFGVGVHDDGTGRPSLERLMQYYEAKYRGYAIRHVLPALVFGGAHKKRWARVVGRIEAETGGRAGRFKAFPRWMLVEFIAQERGFDKYFRAAGVKEVYMANAYRRSLIAGAQRSAKVVEVQHGLISKQYPELAWPNDPPPAYMPNEFWAWGKYWGENCDLPSGVYRYIIGAPPAVARLKRQANAKLPGSVLVISQPEQAPRILEATLDLAARHPELKFSIKPHPKELAASKAELPANVKLLSATDNALQLIANAETVIGVYSTALVEALALNCRVGVFNLPGVEHIQPILDRGDATLLSGPSDFAALITQPLTKDDDATAQKRANYYYADPVDLTAIFRNSR